MTDKRLDGKRVLVTQADDYMGPDTIALFREHGAEVIADSSDLTRDGAVEELIAKTGHIDVLMANLAAPANPGVQATTMTDEIWSTMFDMMVHPLQRLCRAVLPQMYQRRAGKIVVFGSATGLKAMEEAPAYSSARFAQVGYVNAVGSEAARHNVQINLIAQNFVENPEYFPQEFQKTDLFKQMMSQVPIGRLATGREDAMFALFLASNESDFFVGQAIPFSGGWTV
jgi:2-keto-3-deoxy-L-fuconate dehydrogenase